MRNRPRWKDICRKCFNEYVESHPFGLQNQYVVGSTLRIAGPNTSKFCVGDIVASDAYGKMHKATFNSTRLIQLTGVVSGVGKDYVEIRTTGFSLPDIRNIGFIICQCGGQVITHKTKRFKDIPPKCPYRVEMLMVEKPKC